MRGKGACACSERPVASVPATGAICQGRIHKQMIPDVLRCYTQVQGTDPVLVCFNICQGYRHADKPYLGENRAMNRPYLLIISTVSTLYGLADVSNSVLSTEVLHDDCRFEIASETVTLH
jgi:hypothetical protein